MSFEIYPACSVTVLNRQREVSFSIDELSVSRIVNAVLEHESEVADFVNVHFVSDKNMRRYHRKFFQDSTSTDCMSFPIDGGTHIVGPRHLGDILVCPKIALRRAKNTEIGFWNELVLYIVHGLLHLLGYDDTDPDHCTMMREGERKVLALFKQRNMALCGILKIKTQF